MDFVYLVPSWKIFPTSIPLEIFTVFFAAFRADAALLDFCKIVILGIRNVALHVESFVMMLCLVGSAGKVISSLEGFIVEDNGISVHLQVHRSDVACVQAAFFGDHGCVNLLAEEVDQLRLVDFEIAADEKDNVFIINILLINNGFAGVLCLVSEEIAERSSMVWTFGV